MFAFAYIKSSIFKAIRLSDKFYQIKTSVVSQIYGHRACPYFSTLIKVVKADSIV